MDQKMMIMLIIGVCCCILISIGGGVGIYFATKKEETTKEEKKSGTPAATLVFKKSLETNKYGGQGGNPGVLLCPQGAFINEVYGRSAQFVIDSIGIKCSDGKTLEPLGGSGGVPFSITSKDGFNKMNVKTGALVDNIELYSKNTKIGSAGGPGGEGPHLLDCNDGKLMGLNLRSGGLVDNIGVICGKEQ